MSKYNRLSGFDTRKPDWTLVGTCFESAAFSLHVKDIFVDLEERSRYIVAARKD